MVRTPGVPPFAWLNIQWIGLKTTYSWGGFSLLTATGLGKYVVW